MLLSLPLLPHSLLLLPLPLSLSPSLSPPRTHPLIRCLGLRSCCGRKFNPSVIEKHERVCDKVFNSKRKVSVCWAVYSLSLAVSHSLSLSLCLSLSVSVSLTLTHSLSLPLPLYGLCTSRTWVHEICLSLCLSLSLSLSLPFSRSLPLTLPLALSLSPSPSLALSLPPSISISLRHVRETRSLMIDAFTRNRFYRQRRVRRPIAGAAPLPLPASPTAANPAPPHGHCPDTQTAQSPPPPPPPLVSVCAFSVARAVCPLLSGPTRPKRRHEALGAGIQQR